MGLVSWSKKPEVALTQSTTSASPRGGDRVAKAVHLRLTCPGRDTPKPTHLPGTVNAIAMVAGLLWSFADATNCPQTNSLHYQEIHIYPNSSDSPPHSPYLPKRTPERKTASCVCRCRCKTGKAILVIVSKSCGQIRHLTHPSPHEFTWLRGVPRGT